MGIGISLWNIENPVVAGPFTPTQLAGLTAWFDAADTSTIQQTGGFVSQWNDKSGNGFNATQATGTNQPKTGINTTNGKNVITFDGTDDSFMVAGALTAISNTDLTCFVTIRSGPQ